MATTATISAGTNRAIGRFCSKLKIPASRATKIRRKKTSW